jgi:hypothetical protein
MEEEHYKPKTCKLKFQLRPLSFGIIALLLINTVSAFTFINIFVDETGEAIFLGETDEEIQDLLPSGIELQEGEITGFTSALTSKENFGNFLIPFQIQKLT